MSAFQRYVMKLTQEYCNSKTADNNMTKEDIV